MNRTTQSPIAPTAANLPTPVTPAAGSGATARCAAALLVALLLGSACALRADAAPLKATVRKTSSIAPNHIVMPARTEDVDGDKINDQLERALASRDYLSLPRSVIRPHSTLAKVKGLDSATSTILDLIVCLDHAPTTADTAALTAQGFTVKNVYSHAIYGVHVTGQATAGVQTLRNLVKAVPGITVIEPNRALKFAALASTRQTGARQSWTTYEPHNVDLPLMGDPERAIAIMDTGIDGTHPDLNGGRGGDKITDFEDEISSGTTPVDYYGHGTFVAGIAAGTGQSAGIATGTGYLNMSIPDNGEVYPFGNIPVDTTGFTSGATVTLNGYVPTFYPEEEVKFGILTNSSNIFSSSDVLASTSGGTGTTIPYTISATVAAGTQENLYAAYKTHYPEDENTAVMAVSTPNTAIGDGFNLVTGVAPASELVSVRVGDNSDSIDETAVINGFDYISINAQRYNIGVLNMSFGDEGDPTVTGDYGIDTVEDTAVDELVEQGIVCVAADGNSQADETAGTATVNIASPASATDVIAVGAVGNVNQLTDYTAESGSVTVTHDDGTTATYTQLKPDVVAPGGSYTVGDTPPQPTHDEALTSVDDNYDDSAGFDYIQDVQANDYTNEEGTSFASPHVAGVAALLEQAMTLPGAFGGQAPSGADEALTIKSLLEMTTTKPVPPTETSSSTTTTTTVSNSTYAESDGIALTVNDPSARDPVAGFGKINADAALGAVLNTILPGGPTLTGSFGAQTTTTTPTLQQLAIAPEAYAANVTLTAGQPYTFTLALGSTADTTAVYQLYLYSTKFSVESTTDLLISNGSDGDPIAPELGAGTISTSSSSTTISTTSTLAPVTTTTTATAGYVYGEGSQAISYTPKDNETDILVVRQISGNGAYTLASTGYTAADLDISVVDATTGDTIPGAEVVATGTDTGLQYNQGPTVATTTTTGSGTSAVTTTTTGLTLPVPAATALTLDTTAFGYYGETQASAASATSAKISLTPSHSFTTLGLQMISVPMGYSGQTIAEITLPELDTAAVWSPLLNAYSVTPTAPANTFAPGQGYWVRLKQPTSINIQGSTVAAGSYPISLQAGWNMIGSPYANPSSLASATVTPSGGTSESYAAANAAGTIGVLYSYDPASNAYDALTTSSALTPYLGYWVYAAQACILNIAGS